MPARPPLRILTVGNLYPPHHLGGYELLWEAAVEALRAAGHDVRVLTTTTRLPGAPDGDGDAPVHRELEWYWRDHAFPRRGLRDRVRLERRNLAVLDRHLAEQRPHLLSWWAMGGMSMSLIERGRRAALPALAWVIDDWPIYGPRVDAWARTARRLGPAAGAAERALGVPARLRLEDAAAWIFCSRATREAALSRRPGLAPADVVPLGVADVFGPAPEPEGWSGRLLYVGRLDERKGLFTLAEAMDRLPGARLRIVGAGDAAVAERLRARVDPARVELAGPLPRADLQAAYAAADAVVFPVEWSEPFGLVPLEAMAVGRPVVATGLGGSGEYLEHERNALLVPPGDPPALAAAVRRLAADAGLRSRLRAGGLATAARLTEGRWRAEVVARHEAAAAAADGARPRRAGR